VTKQRHMIPCTEPVRWYEINWLAVVMVCQSAQVLGVGVQAEDRLHRIGQTEVVEVYRLLHYGTIDTYLAHAYDAKIDNVSGFKTIVGTRKSK
jgi:hypothetical protein